MFEYAVIDSLGRSQPFYNVAWGLMPPYLVSRILEIFLQFCLNFSENFSSGLLIYSQG